MKKYIFIILFFSSGALLIIGSLSLLKNDKPKTAPSRNQILSNSPAPEPNKKDTTITIIIAGDVMLDRGVEYAIKKDGNGDFKFPFLKIADELKKADIAFGNLEGPVSDKGTKIGSIYSFRADPKAIEGLNYAGFNILSVSNNHALDYGRKALEDTFLRLKNSGISYVGGGFNKEEAYSPVIKEIKGIKIGFLAYTNLCSKSWNATEETSGVNCISEENFEDIKKVIQETKNKTDIVIVSIHSGEEYSQTITAFQSNFSKMAIEAGANFIAGHHPHVVQKNELYSDKHIFYSLGNFIFDQDFSEETMKGEIVKLIVEDGKIKEAIPMKTKINEYFQPKID